jgi:hypothetical protein
VGAVDKNGEWIGTYLGKDESGLRLGEHERFDHNLERGDLFEQTPDDVIMSVAVGTAIPSFMFAA